MRSQSWEEVAAPHCMQQKQTRHLSAGESNLSAVDYICMQKNSIHLSQRDLCLTFDLTRTALATAGQNKNPLNTGIPSVKVTVAISQNATQHPESPVGWRPAVLISPGVRRRGVARRPVCSSFSSDNQTQFPSLMAICVSAAGRGKDQVEDCCCCVITGNAAFA